MKKISYAIILAAVAILSYNLTAKPSESTKKIYVCHVPPGNPEGRVTILISPNSLQAHLAHGDYEGRCEDYQEPINHER